MFCRPFKDSFDDLKLNRFELHSREWRKEERIGEESRDGDVLVVRMFGSFSYQIMPWKYSYLVMIIQRVDVCRFKPNLDYSHYGLRIGI